MSVTIRPEQLSNFTRASDYVSKQLESANLGQSCNANRAYYRLTRSVVAGNTLIPNVIPLKAPCNYLIKIRWAADSSGTNIVCDLRLYQVSQQVPGGAITSVLNTVPFSSQSTVGNVITLSKNATNDTIDVTVNNVSSGGVMTEVIDIEVFANKSF